MTNILFTKLPKLTALGLMVLSACASSGPVPASAQPQPQASPASQPVSQAFSGPAQPASQQARFDSWKQDFIARAAAKGYNRALLSSLIGPAVINEKALERDKAQPEFTKPIWVYINNARSSERMFGGKAKLAEDKALFDQIEARYRVPREYLTAIWGLESAYGKIQGKDDIVSSLSTLAFEGRRASFGEQQLFAILDIVRDGKVRPDQLIGSWAGAMGMMQFIPSTFRDYAVDFDSNGNIDMWTDEGDALGSAAHYLSRHGWIWGEPSIAEVTLPAGFDYSLSDGRKKSVADWARLGVKPVTGQNWSQAAQNLQARLLVPAGSRGPKMLTFKNFDVIKRYNNSTSYALGITSLAMAFKNKAAIRTPWPESDQPLSLTDKKALQQRLTDLGYNTKGVDGKLGPNSRKALRAWQNANGVTSDGYVEQSLFRKIMGR